MHWRQQVLNDSLDSFDAFLLRILQFEKETCRNTYAKGQAEKQFSSLMSLGCSGFTPGSLPYK